MKPMHVCYMTYVPLWSRSTVCTLPSFHEWSLYYRKHMWGQRYYCHLASLFSEDCFFIQFLLIFKTNIFGRKFRDIPGIYFKLNLFLRHPFLPLLFSNWKNLFCIVLSGFFMLMMWEENFLITFKDVMMHTGLSYQNQ